MNKMIKFVNFEFLPASVDLGLLLLRVWVGVSLFALHGLDKMIHFGQKAKGFPDPLGIGSTASLVLVVFAEGICSLLIAAGLGTRFAAVVCAINMAVAFFIAHHAVLKGPRSGEMAFLYLGAFVVLLITGPGRFSLDRKLGGKPAGAKA